MARTKSKDTPSAVPVAVIAATPAGTAIGVAAGDVLTLPEAATYLRLGEDEVVRLVRFESLPGRQVGGEWRFLKSAIQDWLRTPTKLSNKEALMAMAGKHKDDPFLEEICREAYRQRRLSVAEDGD